MPLNHTQRKTVRRGTGQPIHPKRVEFERPETHRAVYEKHFQCPVKFKAAKNVLVFNKADIDATFLTYNADLLAAVAPQLEAELKQQLAEKSFREQVKGDLFGEVVNKTVCAPKACANFRPM